MAINLNEDDITRKFIKKARVLKETIENGIEYQKNEIIVDKNDANYKEIQNNITKFVGALKIDDKSQIVYPKDNDVIFNGVITDLNNLKFQFRYNDQSGGLYIWSDSMLLTRDVSEKLAKLVIIREQWKDYWSNTISQYVK